MTLDDQTTDLLTLIAAVVALSVAYSQTLGPYQYRITEWVIEAFTIRSRYKGLTNLGVGMILAACFGVLVAIQSGEWLILATVVLAGVLASVKAADEHDKKEAPPEQEKPGPTPLVTQGQVRR